MTHSARFVIHVWLDGQAPYGADELAGWETNSQCAVICGAEKRILPAHPHVVCLYFAITQTNYACGIAAAVPRMALPAPLRRTMHRGALCAGKRFRIVELTAKK